MVFRRVTAEQYSFLYDYVHTEDIPYEIKTLGKTLMFGMSRYDWRRLDFAGAAA
jgi:hypothetical protein